MRKRSYRWWGSGDISGEILGDILGVILLAHDFRRMPEIVAVDVTYCEGRRLTVG